MVCVEHPLFLALREGTRLHTSRAQLWTPRLCMICCSLSLARDERLVLSSWDWHRMTAFVPLYMLRTSVPSNTLLSVSTAIQQFGRACHRLAYLCQTQQGAAQRRTSTNQAETTHAVPQIFPSCRYLNHVMLHGSQQSAVAAALIFSYLLKTPSCPVRTCIMLLMLAVCPVLTCIIDHHQPVGDSVMSMATPSTIFYNKHFAVE